MDIDDGDSTVVREIPVCALRRRFFARRARAASHFFPRRFLTGTGGGRRKRPGLVLLQYPVRGKARGEERFTAARVKPKNAMVELDAPATTSGRHHDPKAPDRMQRPTRTLASSLVLPETNYAVGTLRDGALYLAPLDRTFQMRPSFAYPPRARRLPLRGREDARGPAGTSTRPTATTTPPTPPAPRRRPRSSRPSR